MSLQGYNRDCHGLILNAVYHPGSFINPPAPHSGEVAFQLFSSDRISSIPQDVLRPVASESVYSSYFQSLADFIHCVGFAFAGFHLLDATLYGCHIFGVIKPFVARRRRVLRYFYSYGISLGYEYCLNEFFQTFALGHGHDGQFPEGSCVACSLYLTTTFSALAPWRRM